MDSLMSPAVDMIDAREALHRYFAGFGMADTAELDRLTAAVLAETGACVDAETALLHAEALVGAWFAQTIGLSRDYAALAPAMAMAAFQRGRFPAGTLLSAQCLAVDTALALALAVPNVRPASSGLAMQPQSLNLPSLTAFARRLIARGESVDAEPVSSTAH
jgi:hypothetical protein